MSQCPTGDGQWGFASFEAAWCAAGEEQLRAALRMTPDERLRAAEELLEFAMATPRYRHKLDDPLERAGGECFDPASIRARLGAGSHLIDSL